MSDPDITRPVRETATGYAVGDEPDMSLSALFERTQGPDTVLSFAAAVRQVLPAGWTIHDPDMDPDFLLSCPHGNVIELEGRCSQGCVSPLPAAGLV